MENKKNVQIEAIRVISMILIVIFHYTYRFEELFNINTIYFDFLESFGKIGVGIFFIISGYFLARNYEQKENPIRFLVSKLLRIYPLYAICVTIIYFFISILGLPGRETTFCDYILNLLLINGLIGVDYVDGAHWFLTYLIIYYFMIFLTIIFDKKWKKVIYMYGIANLILYVIKDYVPLGNTIYKLFGGEYLCLILLGIFLKYFLKNKDKNNLFIIFISLLIVLLNFGVNTFIGILFGLILFILATEQKLKFLNRKIFFTLGSMSYIVFLIHQNIGYQILLYLCNLYGGYNVLFIFIVLGIILIISYLLYKYCEIPINKKINKFLRGN